MRGLGVKHGEYLQNWLQSLNHTIVAKETQGPIQRERAALDRSDLDIYKCDVNRYGTGSRYIQYLS